MEIAKMYDYSIATITLYDLLKMNEKFLDIFELDTDEQTNKFKEMFKSRFDIYEIGGETIPLFKRYLENTFNIKKDYYQELINDYEQKINYLDGYISNEIINDDYTHNENYERNNNALSTTQNEQINIDLPNKNISTEYPTSKIKNNDNMTSSVNETSKNSRIRNNKINTTKKGGVNILEQKRQYQKYLRNVYLEFVDEFKNCFVLIY